MSNKTCIPDERIRSTKKRKAGIQILLYHRIRLKAFALSRCYRSTTQPIIIMKSFQMYRISTNSKKKVQALIVKHLELLAGKINSNCPKCNMRFNG